MEKVTLRDVAEAAGVSIATASWAVNDNRDVRITESTHRKVRRAADELGHHHNALARGLARGCSDIIGFISDGVATSPFAGQVIQGAQDEAWRNGKILLVVDTDGRKRRGTQNLLVHVRTPGRGHHWIGYNVLDPPMRDE